MATTILHRIKVYLYENLLTEDANDFSARIISERSLNIRQICEAATTRGKADIPASSMEHAVDLFLTEMAYQLCDGFSVNTGWFTVSAHIKGVFNSPNDLFDPTRHSISFEFQQGDQLRKETSSVGVEIMGVADTTSSISQVTDVKTGSVNDLLTPNRNLHIRGSKVKITGEHSENGIYFVNQSTQARTKVDGSDIAINNPSELMIVIPQLPAGKYKVEITSQFTNSILLKEPRTTAFNKVLTVK